MRTFGTMNSHNKLLVFVTVLFAGLYSCKKDEVSYDLHYGYFGLIPGRFVDYEVMEIKHDVDQSIPHDTNRYQLRTVVGDTIIDNEGRVAREFLRFKRTNASQSWVQTDIWTAIIVDRRAELVEENQRMIKLAFEPSENKEWNPNAFNTYDELTAYYRDIHQKSVLGSLTFDSTLVVEQEDFFSLIDYRRKYEVYAKNVGLISKFYKDLKISGFDTSNVQSGTEIFYNCIGYGYQ
jgi:hypothetical protein